MIEKSEAIVAFKRFKALVEKEIGKFIKVFRTNHGGEFISHEFTNLCEMSGIRR